eukprot:3722607-Rhodomonas_salina.3
MSGTDAAFGRTVMQRLRSFPTREGSHSRRVGSVIGLRVRYAMPGTDVAYGVTRRDVARRSRCGQP